MRGIGLACTIAALALAANGPVLAQSPVGNTSSGLRVATTICGNCHQVTPTMPPSAVRSPSFADIASRPTTTALSLKQFLRSNQYSHAPIPTMSSPISSASSRNSLHLRGCIKDAHGQKRDLQGSPLGPECQSVDVSNGSKTVLTAPKPDFRSTPINGHHPILG